MAPADRHVDDTGYVASKNSAGLSQSRLQIGGKDFGEEPDSLQHEGRGDSGGKETLCGV